MKVNCKEKIIEINSSEDLINFLVNVEYKNSEKISDLFMNNVDLFYDVYSTLKDLKNVSEISEDESLIVVKKMDFIMELHLKLIEIKDHYNEIDKFLDLFSEDRKIGYEYLKQNTELIL